MDKIIKPLTVCVLTGTFFLCIISAVAAREGGVDFTVEGEVLSANLKEIPLKDILEKLEREKGIWFKGDKSVFAERISVQFTGLPLEEGMKRILASMNYSLLFDEESRLIGVIIIGQSRNGVQYFPPPDKSRVMSTDMKIVKNGPPPENPNAQPIDMKIVRNSPPPENPNAQPIDTKIVTNSPPPENPNAQPIDMRIVRNSPPPENPNAQPIDMTIIKNCPPPNTNNVDPIGTKIKIIKNRQPPGS
jgi:hypothetical protein